jgi:hypothetical protein
MFGGEMTIPNAVPSDSTSPSEQSATWMAEQIRLFLVTTEHAINRTSELGTEGNEIHLLIPICAWCKRVRTGDGVWSAKEDAPLTSDGVGYTHGICPACLERCLTELAAGTMI